MVSRQSSKDPIYEGDNCYRIGDYNNALCWYNKGLRKDPENIILLTMKANVLYNLHRYNKAYECYVKVLLQAKALEIIDQYVERYQSNLQIDIYNLHELLKIKYNIPITLAGLQLVLKKVREDHNKYRKVKEWLDFKKSLQQKHQVPLEEYMYLFLQRFGESFYKHFISFYCYLYEHNIINLTMNQFATILMEHRRKIKLEQFERFLRTGRKQPMLDTMTGTEFVDFLADIFQNKGCLVSKNPPTHDFGADLIVVRLGVAIAVQAKCRKQAVRITAIQEIYGGRDYYHTQRALVVSIGGFTKSAVKLANRLGVELWDRKRLLDEINKPGF